MIGRNPLFASKTDAWLVKALVTAAKDIHAARGDFRDNGLHNVNRMAFTSTLKEIAFRMEEDAQAHLLFKDVVTRMAALSDADADDVLKTAAVLKDVTLPAPIKPVFTSVSNRSEEAAVPVNPFRKFASGV